MFICALRPSGEPLQKGDLFGHMARLRQGGDRPLDTLMVGPFAAVATPPQRGNRPLVARTRYLIGVGDVRLDNRAELLALAGRTGEADSDLELVLHLYAARGEAFLQALAGDYGFVIWDARAQKLVAPRDPFGVKPLYYRNDAGLVLLSSETTPLRQAACYDAAYIAEFLTGRATGGSCTLWADVHMVPAGGCLVQRGTTPRVQQHWSADAFEPRSGTTTADDVDQFRTLLATAVTRQMGAPQETWAHLSGGLDSSAIVAAAQTYGAGVAGTLTVVDSLGAGDERAYSDAVVRRYNVRNEQVTDFWAWQDDGALPPDLDQPWPLFPFYARDRRIRQVVRNAGGRVVLAGVGSDHYLAGNLGYITDLAAGGQVGAAATELAAWGVGTRQSFWGLARQHVTMPLLGLGGARRATPAPRWMQPSFLASTGIQGRLDALAAAPRGRAFATGIAREMHALPAWLERYAYGENIEVRYPFLYRPLVEFALQLPRDGRIRPMEQKWILRQATRGLLPEEVRNRRSKGSIDARVLWSLQRERRRVDDLLHAPILADLGCLDAGILRGAVEQARHGVCEHPVHLMSALGLETWLAVQAGRWSVETAAASHAA
jgi:asparagine synthase (glutamine-hydrolysing)